MKNSLPRLFRSLFLGLLVAGFPLAASANTATEPVPRDAGWIKRHEGFVEEAQRGGIDVLFLGDSITDFWRSRGKKVWDENFASLHAANFGISADRTQHVLWRLEHGEVDGLQPKLTVLLIGTNNTGVETNGSPRNSTAETIEGVTKVIQTLRAKLPATKLLVLGIFPRSDPKGPPAGSTQIPEINAALAKLDDGRMIRVLDLGAKFLSADGSLSKDVMPDQLHPSEKGYEIWAAAIKPTVLEMLK